MTLDIPSPVLARLQVMFVAGATLEEVTSALELEIGGENGVSGAPVDGERLQDLKAHTAALGKKVDALFQLKQLKDVPEVAGALDLIAHETRDIMRTAKALQDKPAKKAAQDDRAAERKTRRSKPSSAGRSPSALSSLPSKSPITRPDNPPSAEPSVEPPVEPPSQTSPLAPASDGASRLTGPSASSTTPSHLDTLSEGLAPAPDSRSSISQPPSKPEMLSADQPSSETPKPAPSAASRPSPVGRDRNSLSGRIADVVDQISAITSEHDHDEEQLSART